MKNAIRPICAAALLGAAISFSPIAFGQETVATTTTSSDGTITEFSPDSVVLRTETSTEPVHYTYSKTTTVVDQNGAPVDISVIKTGVPVQVFYDRDGDRMVARKIVVRRIRTAPAEVTTAPAEVPANPPVVIQKDTTTTTTTEEHH